MQPTKSELEEEIRILSEFITKKVETGKLIARQANPYLDELKHESKKLLQLSKPTIKKQRLKLELMLLKGRRELLKILIERKKREAMEKARHQREGN